MNDNDSDNSLYQTPKSKLQDSIDVDIPKAIVKKIQVGWIAAIVTGVMTMVLMLVALETGLLRDKYDVWNGIDVALIFVLAYGIYRKSRLASTLMFIYFVSSKVLETLGNGQPSGIILTIIFIYLYYQAMIATYQYHKLIKSSMTSEK